MSEGFAFTGSAKDTSSVQESADAAKASSASSQSVLCPAQRASESEYESPSPDGFVLAGAAPDLAFCFSNAAAKSCTQHR